MAMDFFYKAAGAVIAPFRYAEREVKTLKENIKEDAQEAMASLLKMAVVVFCSLIFYLLIVPQHNSGHMDQSRDGS
jgi:hypothetical protein